VVRLVLDGNFDTLLKDDEAAQQIYGIRLCADVADCLQLSKSQLSICALQTGSTVILALVRVNGAPPDDGASRASAANPANSASMSGREQIKSVFAPSRHRSAQDIAVELAEQAVTPMSALRIKRPDVKSGQLISKRQGAVAIRGGAGGDTRKAHSIDVIDLVTDELVSEAGLKHKRKEQPSSTGVSVEELQRLQSSQQARDQARELGSSSVSHTVATRSAGSAARDDNEDDGDLLELLRPVSLLLNTPGGGFYLRDSFSSLDAPFVYALGPEPFSERLLRANMLPAMLRLLSRTLRIHFDTWCTVTRVRHVLVEALCRVMRGALISAFDTWYCQTAESRLSHEEVALLSRGQAIFRLHERCEGWEQMQTKRVT